MKITITLRDTEGGQVQVEEVRQPELGEAEESVTVASVLADDMLSRLDELGEADAS